MAAGPILGAVAVATTVVSAGVSAYGAIRAGREEEKERGRAAAENIEAARREAADEKKRHQRILAAQRARYGTAGVTMEGTPLLVQIESMRESEEQLRRIIESGQRASYAEERAGRRAAKSGYVEAGGELLGGTTRTLTVAREFDWWKE